MPRRDRERERESERESVAARGELVPPASLRLHGRGERGVISKSRPRQGMRTATGVRSESRTEVLI